MALPPDELPIPPVPWWQAAWSWLGWLLVGALSIQRVTQWIGTRNSLISIYQTFLLELLVVSLVWALVAGVLRRWWLSLALVVLVLAHASIVGSWWLQRLDAEPSRTPTVSVVSSNVLFDNSRLDEAAADLAALDADVVVLSEMTTRSIAAFESLPIWERYPHRSVDAGGIGIVVLSVYPLTPTPESDWVSNESEAITVDGPSGRFRVIASHPPPPTSRIEVLNAELAMIGADVRAQGLPTVVAGDLNVSWVHPPLRRLLAEASLNDTLATAGHPWARTWPTDHGFPPFVMLDHVLVTDDFAVVSSRTASVAGTDHRAVVSYLYQEPS